MKNRKAEGKQKEGRKKAIRILMLAAVCTVVSITARVPQRLIFLLDSQSEDGSLAGLAERERQKLMQKAADDSRFTFRINGNISFETGKSKGILFIENPEENTCLLKVKITLDEDGRVLYETGYLKPGTGIGKDHLKEQLPKGEYEATARLTAYTESHEKTGKALAGIHITIRN